MLWVVNKLLKEAFVVAWILKLIVTGLSGDHE